MKLRAGVASRELHMEDRTLVSLGMHLFGVFDGVSANGGGAEVAAIAVDAVRETVAESGSPTTVRQAQQLLSAALRRANAAIGSRNRRFGLRRRPSATTAAVVLIFQPVRLAAPSPVAVAATVGDSRIMLIRAGRLFTLTLDHSLFAEGDLGEAQSRQERVDLARSLDDLEDPQDRAAFTHRNLIFSALDGSGDPNARFYAFRLVPGDRLLVDSDGIHDNLSPADLTRLSVGVNSPQEMANAVTEAAWRRSRRDRTQHPRAKPDDMSLIVIEVPDAPAA